MAWGKSTAPPPPSSTFSKLLPLTILLVILAAVAFVAYQIYDSVVKIQAQASKKFNNKNVVFTKDGVRVGVKHVDSEKYVDATQNWVVKAWNLQKDEKDAQAKEAANSKKKSKSK